MIGRGAPALDDIAKGKKRKGPTIKKTSQKVRVQTPSSVVHAQVPESASTRTVVPTSFADPVPSLIKPIEEPSAPTQTIVPAAPLTDAPTRSPTPPVDLATIPAPAAEPPILMIKQGPPQESTINLDSSCKNFLPFPS